MTKEEAEKRIQTLLAEVQFLADEHKIEFKFLGCTMHYYRWSDDTVPAKTGLLVSDDEWKSSDCWGPVSRWEYDNGNFPDE